MFKHSIVRGLVLTVVAAVSAVTAVAVNARKATPSAAAAVPAPTPTSARRIAREVRRSVALYGDSLSVMAWDYYRWITAGVVETDDHRWSGTELGHWRDSILSNPHARLVLALGTNDAMRDGARSWADLFDELSGSKCIVWPKPHEGSTMVADFNTRMASIVASHPNVHVIDRDAQVKGHPEWVLPDHTHYVSAGREAYAWMLEQAALTCP
jgi:hypothetical protein